MLTTPRGRRTAFSATTTVKRQDYGITLNRFMEGAQVVGDEVRVTIDRADRTHNDPLSPKARGVAGGFETTATKRW